VCLAVDSGGIGVSREGEPALSLLATVAAPLSGLLGPRIQVAHAAKCLHRPHATIYAHSMVEWESDRKAPSELPPAPAVVPYDGSEGDVLLSTTAAYMMCCYAARDQLANHGARGRVPELDETSFHGRDPFPGR